MTLRLRTLIASGVALAALLFMGLVLLVQYSATVNGSRALANDLAPAAQTTADITLAQANASGSLSDYLMLKRKASLADYEAQIERASTLLAELEKALPEDATALPPLIEGTRQAQAAWVAADAAPSIALMADGKRTQAMRKTNTKAAWDSYDAMTAASNALHDQVDRTRTEATDATAGFTAVLGMSLLIVGLLTVLGLAAFFVGLQRWVLVPLDQLRRDLQRAARLPGHEAPIEEVGPPELQAVSVDAELLRRGLVKELDEARAAREGLVQDAPLVAAMEAELSARAVPTVEGIELFGTSQSAEGVMAGDWWDPILRPDGSLAIVIADVSGHGPEASVTAVRVRSILRAGLQAALPPDLVVQMAADSCADDSHFATGIVLVIDPAQGTLEWCNAGHHPAIVVTRDKDSYLCEPTGPLISSLGGAWTTGSRDFHGGDVLVAFTDGLVESRNADGDELESSMVSQFIRGLDAPVRENPEELIARLLAQVRHRAADWRRDDVTVVAVTRTR